MHEVIEDQLSDTRIVMGNLVKSKFGSFIFTYKEPYSLLKMSIPPYFSAN